MANFRIENTDDLRRIQENVQRAVKDLSNSSHGTVLEDRDVGTAETRIPHGLGRKPHAVNLSGVYGNATVWQTKRADAEAVYLRASVAVTVDVTVY